MSNQGSEQQVPCWEDDVTSARRGRARHRMRKSLQVTPESVVFEAKVLQKGRQHSRELHPGPSTCFVNVVSRKKERKSKCHSGHEPVTGERYPGTAALEANGSCGPPAHFWGAEHPGRCSPRSRQRILGSVVSACCWSRFPSWWLK